MAIDPTIDVFSQTLNLVKGDSDEFLVTVTEPDLTDLTIVPLPRLAINLSESVDGTADRHAIVRFAAKRQPGSEDNDEGLLYKDSQLGTSDIRELAQSGDTLGQVEVLIDTSDTDESDDPTVARDDDPEHTWDIEANLQDELRSGAQTGTVDVVDGSTTIVGTGTLFTNAKRGDIINLTDGVGANEAKPAIIVEVVSDTEVTVGRSSWSTTTVPVAFEVRRNKRRTVASGDFRFITGVTDG